MLELANRRDRRSEERGAQVIQPLPTTPPRSRPLAVSPSSPASDRPLKLVPSTPAPDDRAEEEQARPYGWDQPPAQPRRLRMSRRAGMAAGFGAAAILVVAALGLIDGREPAVATVPPPAAVTAPPATVTNVAPKPLTREAVQEVQQLLARLGYDPGPIDGVAGPQTRMAIAAFLRARDVEAPPAVDEAVLARLRGELVAITGL